MKTLLLSIATVAALAAPAFAAQCPMLMGEIEAALETSTADEATKATVTALLEEGRALHDAGDHAGSEAKLMEAKAMLGI